MKFVATKARVKNRGVPPDDFIAELIEWGRNAPDEIFATNNEPRDVYDSVLAKLGPWQGKRGSPERILHRKAVMLEILRVLAGFESSWDWSEGVDITNPTSNKPDTMEAGAWQVSANSRVFGEDLRRITPPDGYEFQRLMKSNKRLAIEYAARLLRRTTHHNGPVKRHEIDPYLSRESVLEFQNYLT